VLGDTPFPMASTSKIAIAATFLDGVDKGRLSLDASYPLMVPVKSKRFSSVAAPVRPGAMLTGRKLIERALIYSDNQATDALLAAVGGTAAVNRWIRTTGITGFRLDRDIATLVRDDGEYNPAQMIDERDSATPMAMAELLVGLYQGKWLSAASRSFLLATMERCETGKRRLRGQLPEGVRVAHKTGTLNNTASDVGIVRTPDGRVYAVAIYVTGQGGHAGRDAKIATLSRAIYDGYVGPGAGSYASANR
jgi:beta-lactamase class A